MKRKGFSPYGPNSSGTVANRAFPAWTFGWTIADHADDRQNGGRHAR